MKKLLPGLLVTVILGILSKFVLAKIISNFGSTTIAILLGIVVGNTIFKKDIYNAGVKFSEKKILSIAIALMGVSLNFGSVVKLGVKGVLLVVIVMTFTIVVAYFIGKKLGFNREFSLLMGSGNAVCGSSAIGASAPVLKAKEDEIGISVAVVNLTGTILMFVLPLLAVNIFKFDELESGILIGGSLQSVGQVVASGSMINEEVQEIATLVKMVRVLMLGGVILAFSYIGGKESSSENSKISVPPFIIAFFILGILASFKIMPSNLVSFLKLASSTLLTIAMVGIGMKIKFSDLLSEGPKAMIFGFLNAILQISFVIALIKLFY